MYRDSGKFVFHGVLLVKDRAVYLNLCSFARKSPEMLISLFIFLNDPCVSHEAIQGKRSKSHV